MPSHSGRAELCDWLRDRCRCTGRFGYLRCMQARLGGRTESADDDSAASGSLLRAPAPSRASSRRDSLQQTAEEMDLAAEVASLRAEAKSLEFDNRQLAADAREARAEMAVKARQVSHIRLSLVALVPPEDEAAFQRMQPIELCDKACAALREERLVASRRAMAAEDQLDALGTSHASLKRLHSELQNVVVRLERENGVLADSRAA